MKVISPNLSTQEITIIPRYYPQGVLNLYVTLEGGTTTQLSNITYSVLNGLLTFTITGDYPENNKYYIELREDNTIVYRGKMFSTSQNTQDYKITKNTYAY
jgi:hypothetical protein